MTIDAYTVRAALKGHEEKIIMGLLPDGDARGDEWWILAPDRADTHLGSCSVALSGARAGLWHDFADGRSGDLFDLVCAITGCDFKEALHYLARAVGMNAPDPRLTIRRPDGAAVAEWKRREASGESRGRGCTVAALAEAKHLPAEFLTGLGMRDMPSYMKEGDRLPEAVRIPYLDRAGAVIATRFRSDVVAKLGSIWKRGTTIMPYGLDRLTGTENRIVLVEGESDCWCLWHAGIAAIGIPGASTWRNEWAALLPPLSEFYIVQEPDTAGSALVETLMASPIAGRLRVLRLLCKDPADLWKASRDVTAFAAAMGIAMDVATEPPRARMEKDGSSLAVVSAVTLAETFTAYRPALIDGLLREGETMNVIAAPKVGKSWLVLLMAFSLANGRTFLGRACQRCPVLILDNELHPETAAQRLRAISEALALPLEDIHVISLRGHLEGLPTLATRLVKASRSIAAKVMIFDALYRLLPDGVSENDNAGMSQLYNVIDRIASESGAAIVCIHHSSKGNQGEKSVTDGGSGAGSISRAADTHLFLREHDEPEHVVIDAVARSWPRPDSCVVRKAGCLWVLAEDADPALVKGRKPANSAAKVSPARFLDLVPELPTPWRAIAMEARSSLHLSDERTRQLLAQAVQRGDVFESTGASRGKCYSRRPASQGGTDGERATAYLLRHPGATAGEAASALGVSEKTIRRSPAWGYRTLDNLPGQPQAQPLGLPIVSTGQPTFGDPYKGPRRLSMSTPSGCPRGRDHENLFSEHPAVAGGE